MTAPLIKTGGWPGSEKRTIGRELAKLINGRFLHNHLALDPANAVLPREDPRYLELRQVIRAQLDAAAQTLPRQIPLIVTDALQGAIFDRDQLFAPTLELAHKRGALLRAVILDKLRATVALLRPETAIIIDVTTLSPKQAAMNIISRLGLSQEPANA
jgi:hypothetical protein